MHVFTSVTVHDHGQKTVGLQQRLALVPRRSDWKWVGTRRAHMPVGHRLLLLCVSNLTERTHLAGTELGYYVL